MILDRRSFMILGLAALTVKPVWAAGIDVSSPEALARGPSAIIVGNPQGDVTIFEFFDYQCPYCKVAHPGLTQLLREDAGIRLVYKQWPMLGEASRKAARLALAARFQGRFEAVHDALMLARGPLTEDKLADALESAQVDMARLKTDLSSRATEIQAALDEADGQARAIGLDGTPAFIVGDYLLPGAVSLENLRRIVKDVRKKPGAADTDRT